MHRHLSTRTANRLRTSRGNRALQIESLEGRSLMAHNIMTLVTLPRPAAPAQPAIVAAPTTQATTARQNVAIQTIPSALAAPVAASTASTPAALTSTGAKALTTTAATTTAAPKIDLDCTLATDYVVPAVAIDLNLSHFYGGEKLIMPCLIKNYGPDTAKGSVTVTAYLSTTQNSTSGVKIGQLTTSVNLADNAAVYVGVQATVPTSLVPGTNYWIVTKITTTLKQSTINDVRTSARTFEFVGTPVNQAKFESMYFDCIRSVMNHGTVVPAGTNPNYHQLNDPKTFIGYFEGDKVVPYVNYHNFASVGTGINLDGLSASMTTKVATTVRLHYLAAYGKVLSLNDNDVIKMLRDQARRGDKTVAIDAQDDGALFNADYKERQQTAITVLGSSVWSRLPMAPKIAVMDMVYEVGSVYTGVANVLRNLDYVRAGFELINVRPNSSDPWRTLAQYQNMLAFQQSTLGKWTPE